MYLPCKKLERRYRHNYSYNSGNNYMAVLGCFYRKCSFETGHSGAKDKQCLIVYRKRIENMMRSVEDMKEIVDNGI